MGAVVGGLVGGVFGGGGGLLGGLASSLLGSAGGIVNNLVDKFGLGDVMQSVTNTVSNLIGNGLTSLIDNSPLPDFLKDGAKSLVSSVVGEQQGEVPCDCQEAVDQDLGTIMDNFVQDIMDYVNGAMEEEANGSDGSEGGGSSGGASGGSGSGNWLMMLAKALGQVNGQHLQTMVEKAQELSSLADQMEGADDDQQSELAAQNATVTAEMQGASRMFSMAQEASSTVLKSIGEGLSSMARKQ